MVRKNCVWLVIVKPDTLIGWHRKAFRLFWRWKSRRPGRPRIPANLQHLIVEMATANRTWGEERIATELLVKLGIHASPRTIRRFLPVAPDTAFEDRVTGSEHLCAESRTAVLACDFWVVVTATFRMVYIFVVLDVGTRRITHGTRLNIRRRHGPRSSSG